MKWKIIIVIYRLFFCWWYHCNDGMVTPHKLANGIMVKWAPFQKMVTTAHLWREGHWTSACGVFFKIWDHYSLHSLLPVELPTNVSHQFSLPSSPNIATLSSTATTMLLHSRLCSGDKGRSGAPRLVFFFFFFLIIMKWAELWFW